jgi:hypothetical protein
MDINAFKSKIGGSLASPANFRVMISGAVVDQESSRDLAILCNQAQLPGRYFQTADRVTHGPITKIPSASIFDEMILSFYCQEGMGVYELFTDWQSYIQDNTASNEFSYFDDYVSDITIEQLTPTGSVAYAVTLVDAYPRMVSPMQLDWSSKDSFHNLQISMVYRYWRKVELSVSPFSKFLNVSSLFPNFDLGGALQQTGVALFDKAGGKLMSQVGQNIRFSKNIKASKSAGQQG